MNLLLGFLCLVVVSSTNAFLTQNERHRILSPVSTLSGRTAPLYPKTQSKNDQRILTHHTQLSVRGGESDDDNGTSSSIEKAKAFVSKNFFLLGMAAAVSFAKLFPQVREDGVPRLYYVKNDTHLTTLHSSYNNIAWQEWKHIASRAIHWKVWSDCDLSSLRVISKAIRTYECFRQCQIE